MKSQVGIAETAVVKVGGDAARGRSCSISLVAEAAQEMTTTMKKRKLSLNIVCAREVRIEGADLDFFSRTGKK